MGLAGLNAALAGLRISQQQISVLSNNIANVGTPGFTRKILPQSTTVIGGQAAGVRAETIIRSVDLNLERDLWTQVSATGFYNVKQTYLNRIEQFHGPPDKELSVAAEIARLKDAFATLADSPEDAFLLARTVDQAVDTANKINDLAELLTTLRNDTQEEMLSEVARANGLLQQIADFNREIAENLNVGRTVANLEDQRDEAVKQLTEIMEISFFTRGDGMMVVQTNRGTLLVDEKAKQLFFDPQPLSPASTSAAGLYVGDPDNDPSATDLAPVSPGGSLGALLELRDEILPRQTAQLDELAHKLALRFEAQGLRLFTDAAGTVPADTPPDPAAGPPPTAVEYVGFASIIQVNENILNDNSLLQQGTVPTDLPVQEGSNEVLRRVLEFTFGSVEYQQATGVIDLNASTAPGGPYTLQDWLGVFSQNTIHTVRDIASIGDLINAPGSPFTVPGADTFNIEIDPGGEGPGPLIFAVNMNAVPPAGNATAADLAAFIDGLSPEISASLNAQGQLEITSRWDINIADVNMGQTGFDFLGLPQGLIEAEDPYFDVQIGNDPPVRITIEPGDDETDLIDKLILNAAGDAYNPVGDATGIPGLAFDEATFAATGELILRPGDDFNNPNFGGDFKIISGSFRVDAASAQINVVTPGTLADGINVVSALFGSFSAGPPLQNTSPIANVSYGSQVSASNVAQVAFRSNFLGPNADISTGLSGISQLTDYAQKMVNNHAQEKILTENRLEDEKTLQDILQEQLLNDSAVNIDEELSNLIVVQTAFAASARVVTAVDEMFTVLLNAVSR